jgi:hypothetical protein
MIKNITLDWIVFCCCWIINHNSERVCEYLSDERVREYLSDERVCEYSTDKRVCGVDT